MKIDHRALQDAATTILMRLGENEENAKIASEVMVVNDLRGIGTHGTNLLRMIAKRRDANMINLPTTPLVISDDLATALVDGCDGLGQVAAFKAMKIGLEKARIYGIGMVLVRNTNNVGSLGYYVHSATMHNSAAIMMTNGNPSMAPYGGTEPLLGTNPIAFAVPSANGMPIMLDMSSSVVARGKIRLAALKNEKIPKDWALSAAGMPTDDPKEALKGCLMAVGGPKGSGLAIMVDIFSGLLSGSAYSKKCKSFHELEGKTGVGACFFAIDISRYMAIDQFKSLVEAYGDQLKTSPRREGFDEIFLPGEIELRKEHESRLYGVEMSEEVLNGLNAILDEYKTGITLKARESLS